MNRNEVIDLLSLVISARDNRTAGKAAIDAWLEDIGDLSFADAKQAALGHFREEPGVWLMSGHIRKRVQIIREDRIAHDVQAAIAQPTAATEEDYRAALYGIRKRLGDGIASPFRAIAASPTDSKPNEEFNETKETLKVKRTQTLITSARNVDPSELDAPTCDCGLMLDPDGTCFMCPQDAKASS
jgi:hypothetical protein